MPGCLALNPVVVLQHACAVRQGRQPAIADHGTSLIAVLEQALQDMDAKVGAGKVVAGTGGCFGSRHRHPPHDSDYGG